LNSREDTSRSKLKLLVDTIFLLPAMGIETDEEAMGAMKHFHMVEFI